MRRWLVVLSVVGLVSTTSSTASPSTLRERLTAAVRSDPNIRPFAVAETAVKQRLASDLVPRRLLPQLRSQLDALETARRLLASKGDGLAVARIAAGSIPPASAPGADAAVSFAVAHGAPAAAPRIGRELARFPGAVRAQIERLLGASALFRSAARAGAWPVTPALLGARLAVLDAALALRGTALDESPIDMPPLLRIDLTATDDVYTADYALVLDAGGNDVYRNNAGGSGLVSPLGVCRVDLEQPDVIATAGSAVLVDLGGDDAYGDPAVRRGCGVNGGAVNGAGFLYDASGDDVYVGGKYAVNGGAFQGAGFLYDGGGADRYDAKGIAVNGGGAAGSGFLHDAGESADSYVAPPFIYWYADSTNGGASRGGLGFLFDEGGDDRYLTAGGGTNGGGWGYGSGGVPSQGFLLDGGGSDVYDGDKEAANGAGYIGTGFLYDAGDGDDVYDGGTWMEEGTNGAGVEGVGFLLDEGGDDSYRATDYVTNGAGYFGAGFLIDLQGDDVYVGGRDFTNGEGFAGAGLLFDAAGSDRFEDWWGACADCSIVPKGPAGAQIDR